MAQEIIPPRKSLNIAQVQDGQIRMPAGTPLGMGVLGAMRLSAIRRVYEHAQRAEAARSALIEAQNQTGEGLVRREAVLGQLENVDTIRRAVATRIIKGAKIEEAKLDIELLELEERKRQLEDAARQRRAPAAPPPGEQAAAPADEFADLMMILRRMPEITKAAAAAKADIIRDAGGEDKLSDANREMLATIDAIVQGAAARQAEETLR